MTKGTSAGRFHFMTFLCTLSLTNFCFSVRYNCGNDSNIQWTYYIISNWTLLIWKKNHHADCIFFSNKYYWVLLKWELHVSWKLFSGNVVIGVTRYSQETWQNTACSLANFILGFADVRTPVVYAYIPWEYIFLVASAALKTYVT